MKTVSITEARNRLSALIDIAKAGETVVITDRGIPVVHLTSAALRSGTPEDDEGRIARLERAGLITRPKGPPVDPAELRKRLEGRPPSGVLEALLEERREGR